MVLLNLIYRCIQRCLVQPSFVAALQAGTPFFRYYQLHHTQSELEPNASTLFSTWNRFSVKKAKQKYYSAKSPYLDLSSP